jgi:hypothetical protein
VTPRRVIALADETQTEADRVAGRVRKPERARGRAAEHGPQIGQQPRGTAEHHRKRKAQNSFCVASTRQPTKPYLGGAGQRTALGR